MVTYCVLRLCWWHVGVTRLVTRMESIVGTLMEGGRVYIRGFLVLVFFFLYLLFVLYMIASFLLIPLSSSQCTSLLLAICLSFPAPSELTWR